MFYGIDSDTATFPKGATTHDFYIGRLGSGIVVDTRYFNKKGAALASHVYMYWGLKGPCCDPVYSSCYSRVMARKWGEAQAAEACLARGRNPWVNRKTIFGDVERGFGGWLTDNGLNYEVFLGFLDEVKRLGSYAGAYSSPGEWHSIMGLTHSIGCAQFVWGANYRAKAEFHKPPNSMTGCDAINGVRPSLWQYYGESAVHDPLTTGDANVALLLPS